jgi:hypothetical protein
MRAHRELFKRFEGAGFTLVRKSNHAIWRCPCGHAQLTTPRTPGLGGRGLDNCYSELSRALKICNQRRSAAA